MCRSPLFIIKMVLTIIIIIIIIIISSSSSSSSSNSELSDGWGTYIYYTMIREMCYIRHPNSQCSFFSEKALRIHKLVVGWELITPEDLMVASASVYFSEVKK